MEGKVSHILGTPLPREKEGEKEALEAVSIKGGRGKLLPRF